MGPYSHFVLAAKLAPSIQPEHRSEYLWGAVAADIRYLANMRRVQTHLSQDRLKALAVCYPHLRSFLLGYQVHVLIDEIEPDAIAHMVETAFPLNLMKQLLRKRIAPEQMTMMVEMVSLQSETVESPLAGEYNEVLADLGITPEQSTSYQQALREYFTERSLESALSAFQQIGMIQNSRIERYQQAFRTMQKRKWMNRLLMLSIHNARLYARVMEHVRSRMTAQDGE